MTVINPNSISGITSITLPSGGDNVLTIHTNDGTERFRIDSSGNVKVGSAATISPDGDLFVTGVCTATTLSGAASGLTGALPAISGANLTNLTAGNLTGALPAISGANLTGIGGTDFIHAEQINVSGVTTSQAFIPLQGQLSHRNLIINGDYRIAQRGTSSTSNGYQTVDRWNHNGGNTGVTITFSQQSTTSSDTPYQNGFSNFFRIALSGAGTANANAYAEVLTKLEAQDIANSGWNFKSSSSDITLSFWVRPSTNQTFYGLIRSYDGTSYANVFSFTASANNTWTKITKTIPGNSNLQFDNNNAVGLQLLITPFYGTDYTNDRAVDTWTTFDSSNHFPDMASTWLTAGASTFDITGVQLEVGQAATPFEHRKLSEELALCQRYFYLHLEGNNKPIGNGTYWTTNQVFCPVFFPVEMREAPSAVFANDTINNWYGWVRDGTGNYEKGDNWSLAISGVQGAEIYDPAASGTAGHSCFGRSQDASAKITFSAEL